MRTECRKKVELLFYFSQALSVHLNSETLIGHWPQIHRTHRRWGWSRGQSTGQQDWMQRSRHPDQATLTPTTGTATTAAGAIATTVAAAVAAGSIGTAITAAVGAIAAVVRHKRRPCCIHPFGMVCSCGHDVQLHDCILHGQDGLRAGGHLFKHSQGCKDKEKRKVLLL